MNFLEEIKKLVCTGDTLLTNDYRYVNMDGKYVYIEGIVGIKNLSEKEIMFNLKKKTIAVLGEDLFIKYFDNSTATIQGRIISVTVL